jgi:hypothetical protein
LYTLFSIIETQNLEIKKLITNNNVSVAILAINVCSGKNEILREMNFKKTINKILLSSVMKTQNNAKRKYFIK